MIIETLFRPIRPAAIATLMLTISALAFSQDRPRTRYGMLLDNTGSMRSQFGTVLDIGKAIVHETAAHGPVSIFNFATDRVARSKDAVVVLRIEQSQDEAKLNRTIDGFYVEGGQTTLLDAIQNVGDRLQNGHRTVRR